ncbi:MAG: hypothetical protein ACXVHX_22690 [Solirubrobacteraceae bacterium]
MPSPPRHQETLDSIWVRRVDSSVWQRRPVRVVQQSLGCVFDPGVDQRLEAERGDLIAEGPQLAAADEGAFRREADDEGVDAPRAGRLELDPQVESVLALEVGLDQAPVVPERLSEA